MEINTYFIRLACMIMLIFGGTFIVRYVRTDELLVDQMIGVSVGFTLLICSLLWRLRNKKASNAGVVEK